MLPSSNALAIFCEEQRLTNAPNVQTTPLVFTEVEQRSGYGFPFHAQAQEAEKLCASVPAHGRHPALFSHRPASIRDVYQLATFVTIKFQSS
jgi:hypothetical protein